MTPETFLKEFGAIANAPGGGQRLRELILQLAVMGKLVAQNPEDEPASELLEKIELKKKQLISEKLLKKSKKIQILSRNNIPWEIPESWEWSFLGNVTSYANAHKLNPSDLKPETWVLELEDIEKISSRILKRVKFKDRASKSTKSVFKKGDVIYGKLRPYLDKVLVADDEGVCTTEMIPLNGFGIIIPEYIRWFLKSPWFINYANTSTHGMNLPRLGTEKARQAFFPCPPLAEQKRIVTKVDQLMTLCDNLEAQQQERAALTKQTRISVLNELANAQGGKGLQIAWKRVQENLLMLFDHPDDVEDLKSAIKNLAVSGNLTQLPKFPKSTGRQLLHEIEQTRMGWESSASGQELKEAQLIARKIKKQKVDYPSKVFLPKHWEWASFLQISQAVIDCHNKTAPYVDSGIHLVRTTDIRNGKMNLKKTKKISKETYDFWARRMHPVSGDIFFTREAPMGEAAIVPDGETVCLGQRTMLIRLFPELFDRNFLLYVIYSPSFIKRMQVSAIGATVKHLRVGDVENLLVPVPPMEEQTLIVRRTQSLISLCDHFQKQLHKFQTIAEQLAQSMVETITGQSTEKKERMKAPKTELVSKLKLVKKPGAKVHAPLSAILVKNNDELSAKALWNTSGLAIDDFYRQLKIEMVNGWIEEPEKAHVRITEDQGNAR